MGHLNSGQSLWDGSSVIFLASLRTSFVEYGLKWIVVTNHLKCCVHQMVQLWLEGEKPWRYAIQKDEFNEGMINISITLWATSKSRSLQRVFFCFLGGLYLLIQVINKHAYPTIGYYLLGGLGTCISNVSNRFTGNHDKCPLNLWSKFPLFSWH